MGLWFAAGGEFPFAECSCQKLVLGVPSDGASALSGQAGSGGMAGAWAQNFFARPILPPHEGELMGTRFRALETPSNAAGPRVPGAALPALPYGERGAGAEKGLRCFLDSRHVGAVVCCPRRVSLCRMQLPEARFGPSVQRGLGAERPSWLKGHGWGGQRRLSRAESCFPTKENPWGVGFGHRRPPAKQQGPRSQGNPAPVRHIECGEPGA